MSISSSLSSPAQPTEPTRSGSGGWIFDHSHWGRLVLSGAGGLEYLNNQSTNELSHLEIGQGCRTVFVTATAQILDLTTVLRTESEIWLLTSPSRRQRLREILMRTLIFVRGAKLVDRTEETVLLRLVGSQSHAALSQLGLSIPADLPAHQHLTLELNGSPIRVIGGNDLGLPGFMVVGTQDQAESLRQALAETDLVWGDEQIWEQLSLLQGRPEADRELTEAYNPLEAGLWSAISLSKGCYIGQEVLAKQVTYGRIRQTLWGVQLPEAVEPGTEVQIDGDKAGVLTRAGWTEEGYVGLAYIRAKFSPQIGQSVQIGGISGTLVQRPYLSYPPRE